MNSSLHEIEGLTRINGCCSFRWVGSDASEERYALVEPDHCADCVAELERRGFHLVEYDSHYDEAVAAHA